LTGLILGSHSLAGWFVCLFVCLFIYWNWKDETESGNELSKMRSLAIIRPAFTSDSILC